MIELENISFSNEYFCDEVRCGFFIPEMMKRLWAAQLVVLSEVDRVCKKHSINYFADMGTLIGAVRHKGYVPWDDDLDISMMREDWEKFFKVAKKELPEGFVTLTIKEGSDYNLSVGRVTNAHTISWDKERLDRFCGCPYVVGVDIFPIDRIYKDPEREADRKLRVKEVYDLCDHINKLGRIDNHAKDLLAKIENRYDIKFNRSVDVINDLVVLYEKLNRECRDEDATEAAFMWPWIFQKRMNNPIEVYQDLIEVPFENTTIKIPARYDELLKSEYGDYMKIYKGGAVHDYPVYRDQEKTLREHLGRNPYRYTFSAKDFSTVRYSKGMGDMYREMEELSSQVKTQIEALAVSGKSSEADKLMDQHKSIEKLIDDLFGDKLMDQVIKNEILFMPCKAAWWDSMKPLYDKLSADDMNSIHVIPIPWFDCDVYGNVFDRHDDRTFFEKELASAGVLTTFEDYDVFRSYPDVIVVQVPYDEWSGVLTVPEQLYSSKLLPYTEELVYIPCFDVDDPTSDNDKTAISLLSLIEQPAVTYADRIVLKSEKMRSLYIDTMTRLAGGGTKAYWEKKICLLSDYRLGEAR